MSFFLKTRNIFNIDNIKNKNNLNKEINSYSNKNFKSYSKILSTPKIERCSISNSELNQIYHNFQQIKKRNNLNNKRKNNYSIIPTSNFHLNFNNKENLNERALYNNLKLQEKILNLSKTYVNEKKK